MQRYHVAQASLADEPDCIPSGLSTDLHTLAKPCSLMLLGTATSILFHHSRECDVPKLLKTVDVVLCSIRPRSWCESTAAMSTIPTLVTWVVGIIQCRVPAILGHLGNRIRLDSLQCGWQPWETDGPLITPSRV